MIDRGIVGNLHKQGAVFYVGGPGRTYDKMRLGLDRFGARLLSLKLCMSLFFMPPHQQQPRLEALLYAFRLSVCLSVHLSLHLSIILVDTLFQEGF